MTPISALKCNTGKRNIEIGRPLRGAKIRNSCRAELIGFLSNEFRLVVRLVFIRSSIERQTQNDTEESF